MARFVGNLCNQGITSTKITPEVPPATEMISDEGVFKDENLKGFMKRHKCGVAYNVTAIMGPQSGGKSTLLNHLFCTNFPTKDGRNCQDWERMTKGIWISEAPNMDGFTMVMDVEGTDGQERGQDEVFQKKTALFCLVVADILIINMWYHDIGRVQAGNWPLLEIIFEEMMKVFKSRPRKATLQFVVRDRVKKTKIGDLKTKLNDDVRETWKKVPKTNEFRNTPLTEIFNVEVDALSHYETALFMEEVVQLREKIQGLLRVAGDRSRLVPISVFSEDAKKLWETIRQNKNIDLLNHRIMNATVRCEAIANEKLTLFKSDKEWLEAKAAAENGVIRGFGAKIRKIMTKYISQYDVESEYFEEGVRSSKRQDLETKAFMEVYPAFKKILDHLRTDVLIRFENGLDELLTKGRGYAESVRECRESCEEAFDGGCSDATVKEASWDASFVRQELVGDMENHALHCVRTKILQQILDQHRARLVSKVSRRLNHVFSGCAGEGIGWPGINSFLQSQYNTTASSLRDAVAEYNLDMETFVQYRNDLKQSARRLVVDKFKDEAASVLLWMKKSYLVSCANNEDPFPKCVKLLLSLAAIRLDDDSSNDANIESLLLSVLNDGGDDASDDGNDGDPLASSTWGDISPKMILITPVECRVICQQFKQKIETAHSQTQSAEKESASYFKQQPVDSETSKGDKENESSREIHYWMRFGTWLLGCAGFVALLCSRNFTAASAAFPTLLKEAMGLVNDCPEWVKEAPKKGWERSKKAFNRIMKSLKKVLMRFYNFMEAKFTRKSEVKVCS